MSGWVARTGTLFSGAWVEPWWEGKAGYTVRWRGGLGQSLAGKEGLGGGAVGLRGFQGSLDPAHVWVHGGPGAARRGSAQMDSGGVG